MAASTSAIATSVPTIDMALMAALEDTEPTVGADGAVVWAGGVPPEIGQIDGPVGRRTDNGQFALQLRAPAGQPSGAPCLRGESD
jgi:hypothetical protein